MRKLEEIDFHDSTVERVEISGTSAILTICDWQERLITIRLNKLLYFRCFELPGLIYQGIVVYESPEIREAIEAVIANGGTAECYNNFKLTQLTLENLVAVFISYEVQLPDDRQT